MKEQNQSVTEAQLNAYVDDLLETEERARIESWLAENPEQAAKVAEWLAQNRDIKALFAGYENPREADVLMVTRPPHMAGRGQARRLAIAAAVVGIFLLGAATGHYGPLLVSPPELQLAGVETLPQEARTAFVVYASEVRHPVEVGADQEAHLATWLGKRLKVPDLKVPNLQSLGFQLVGGRLLPVDGAPGALFMYEDGAGERLTVMIARNPQNKTTSFRFATAGSVDTFYWIDGELGYAVTGEISRTTLRQIAEECYRQFPS